LTTQASASIEQKHKSRHLLDVGVGPDLPHDRHAPHVLDLEVDDDDIGIELGDPRT
jgi:hypothetical protein